MPAPTDVLTRLESSLGVERAAEVIRRLLPVPGATEWLREEAVMAALARPLSPGENPAGHALFAVAGIPSIESLAGELAPPLEALRAALFAPDADAPPSLAADDVVVLAREVILAERARGAAGVQALIEGHTFDWRAPLACVWGFLSARDEIIGRSIESDSSALFAAVLAALRAAGSDDEAAHALMVQAGGSPAGIIARLMDQGEVGLAQVVAAIHRQTLPAAKTTSEIVSPVREVLYQDWETRRARLAVLAEAIAEAAEAESDSFGALEARRQALQLDPNEDRLASVALTHLKVGETSQALALLPEASDFAAFQLAAGMAYVEGGAIEKGRPLLVDGVTAALLDGGIRKGIDVARSLTKCGEVGLALDVLQARLDDAPMDLSARRLYADLLLDAGDPSAALFQTQLLRSLDREAAPTPLLEARAWIASDRPEKALPILRGASQTGDAEPWRRTIECAIAAKALDEAEAMLAAPPVEIDAAERAVIRAKTLEARGRAAESESALQAATLEHSSSPVTWLALAAAQERLGRDDDAGETLRRGAEITAAPSLRTALARWLRLHDRPSEALEAARAAVESDAHDVEAKFELGASLLALGRSHDALDPLRDAHRSLPARQDIRLALATSFEANGDPDAARRLFSHLPDSAPAEAWFTAGRLELARPETDPARAQAAVARLLRARSLGLTEPTLPFWLGRGFEASHQPSRAAEAFGDFLAAHPRDLQMARKAVLGKASASLAIGRAIESLPDLEALRDRSPDDVEVWLALARAFDAAPLPDEAAQAADIVLRHDPGQREALSIIAAAARRTGSWVLASRALSAAAAHVGGDPDLWLESAEASLRLGENEFAREYVETALTLAPVGAARRKAAFALVELGDHERALALLLAAAEETPDDPNLWLEVADVAERGRKSTQALYALERAAVLIPDDVEVHARRAAVLAAAGRPSESIAAWRAAHALRPQDARLHGSLAKALIENGETRAGLEEFTRALAEHPLDAGLLAAAGLAALRLGSPQEAVDLLTRADRATPDALDVVVGLAEAWLQLRRPQSALEILDRSGRAVEDSCVAWALRAEACLSTGDLIGAEEALSEARRRVGASTSDRIALARLESRSGHWRNAIDTLALFMSDPEPEAERLLAEVVVRSFEARWLYAVAAQAERHAPGPEIPGDAAGEWLESYLRGEDEGNDARSVLRLRLQVMRASESEASSFEELRAAAESDGGEAALEAVAVASLRRRLPHDALQALKAIEPDDLGPSWQAILAGIAHLQSGNMRLALAAFEDAARDAALRPLALGLYAQASLAADDPQGAIGALNQALSQWPDEPAWQSALAALYQEARLPDAALPHLQKAAELEPSNAAAQLSLARGLGNLGHATDALHAYDQALPLQAHDPMVWTEAGEAALAAGDGARAGGYFERALDLAPGDPRPMLGAARAALLAGNLRHARRQAEKALETGGEQCDVLRCLADIAARQGESDRALELFDRAVSLSDDSRGLRLARARLLIDLGRPADAADDLRLCLSEDAEDENAWYLLSQASQIAGDLAEAVHAAETAVRLAPRSMACRLHLARLARMTGHLDRALDELNQAQAIDALDPEVAIEIGRVHEARREFDSALDAYQRAAEIDPESAEAFRRAGSVLKSLKAYRDAGRMLERAAEIDPADTPTLQQLAAVRALELVHGETYSMAVNP